MYIMILCTVTKTDVINFSHWTALLTAVHKRSIFDKLIISLLLCDIHFRPTFIISALAASCMYVTTSHSWAVMHEAMDSLKDENGDRSSCTAAPSSDACG